MSIYCDKCGKDIEDGITHQCNRQVEQIIILQNVEEILDNKIEQIQSSLANYLKTRKKRYKLFVSEKYAKLISECEIETINEIKKELRLGVSN